MTKINENSQTMVAAAIQEKPDEFMVAFNAAVLEKIQPMIDGYKLQLQNYFLGVEEQPEEEDEVTEDEIIEAIGPAMDEYLEANPEASQEEALAAVLSELELVEVDEEEEDTEEKSLARGNRPGWSKKSKEEKQEIIKAMKKRHGAKREEYEVDEEEDTEEKSLARGNRPGWSKKSTEEKRKIIAAMKKRHGAKREEVEVDEEENA